MEASRRSSRSRRAKGRYERRDPAEREGKGCGEPSGGEAWGGENALSGAERRIARCSPLQSLMPGMPVVSQAEDRITWNHFLFVKQAFPPASLPRRNLAWRRYCRTSSIAEACGASFTLNPPSNFPSVFLSHKSCTVTTPDRPRSCVSVVSPSTVVPWFEGPGRPAY